MNWSGQRVFGAGAGALLGAMLGVILLSAARGTPLPVIVAGLVLVVLVVNLVVSERMVSRVIALAAQRTHLIATGYAPGEPAPARVHRVFGRAAGEVATMVWPAAQEPARLAILHVLPQNGQPRSVYTLLPMRYGIERGAAAAVILDPAYPDIAILDDRVPLDTLQAIAADPRWGSTRVPSMFVRQGGPATIVAVAAGLLGVLLLGLLLS
ncbi:hypothetical protein [Leucobacter chromiireducens]|uniref:hypothetical protein n=1 Tax=Leucobacter chromiireducens TaxID=283877 RepID=UPI000F630D32|nr:hypothetical protein [Leucobacter chromiireducens]